MPDGKNQQQPPVQAAPAPTPPTIRQQVEREIHRLTKDKQYRTKKIDSRPIKELKGKEHWAFSLTVDLFDSMAQRLDNFIERAKAENARSLMESKQYMDSLRQSMIDLEAKLSENQSRFNAEVLQQVKDAQTLINGAISKIDRLQEELSANINAMKDDVHQANSTLVAAIKEGLGSMQTSLTTELKNARGEIQEQNRVLASKIDTFQSSMTGNLTDFKESVFTKMDSFENSMADNINQKQMAMSEHLKSTSTELKNNITESNKALTEIMNSIASEMKELTKMTDEKFIELSKNLSRRMEEFEKDWKRFLETEIKSLREIISGIRSDIEVQKHLILESVGAKRR